MLPGTAVYLNAGTQLAQMKAYRVSYLLLYYYLFALLGLFPVVTKWVMGKFKGATQTQNES